MSGETPRKLGVTGAIGAGKSTWVRGEMARRGWKAEAAGGFRTGWEGPRGVGGRLFLAAWDGRVMWRGKAMVEGKSPDAAGLAEAARKALEGGGKVLAIDELGIFEAGDKRLAAAVEAAVARSEGAIVVVQERAMAAWRGALEKLDGWRVVGKREGAGQNKA